MGRFLYYLVLLGLLVSRAQLAPVNEELDNEISDEVDNTENASEKDVSPSVVDPEEIKKFNNYMDAVYRRMNAALRAKLMDPMELKLEPKERKKDKETPRKGKKGKKDIKSRETRDVEDVDEDDNNEDEIDRIGEVEEDKKSKKGGNKNKKGKKGRKNKNKDKKKNKNKDLSKSERMKLKEEKKKVKEAKKAAKKEAKRQTNKRVTREADETQEDDEDEVKDVVEGKSNKGRKEKKDRKDKNKKSRNAEKSKKKDKKNKKNKKNKSDDEKEKRKQAKKAKKDAKKAARIQKKEVKKQSTEGEALSRTKRNRQSDDSGKARGSLSGVATLRRINDVNIVNEEDHKLITSEFTVGPLELSVSKAFGKGKERTVRTAKATTDLMNGVIVLKVKTDGSAHVKKVVFKKPDSVDVSGSLDDKQERSASLIRNSFNRSRGLAAQKILKTAKYVLKSPDADKSN